MIKCSHYKNIWINVNLLLKKPSSKLSLKQLLPPPSFFPQSNFFQQDVDNHGGGVDNHGGGATRSSLRTTGEPLPVRWFHSHDPSNLIFWSWRVCWCSHVLLFRGCAARICVSRQRDVVHFGCRRRRRSTLLPCCFRLVVANFSMVGHHGTRWLQLCFWFFLHLGRPWSSGLFQICWDLQCSWLLFRCHRAGVFGGCFCLCFYVMCCVCFCCWCCVSLLIIDWWDWIWLFCSGLSS